MKKIDRLLKLGTTVYLLSGFLFFITLMINNAIIGDYVNGAWIHKVDIENVFIHYNALHLEIGDEVANQKSIQLIQIELKMIT